MDFIPLAPVWHNFWLWFDNLDTPNKIAYWSFLGGVVASPAIGFIAALVGAKYGASAAFKLGRAQQMHDLDDKRYSALISAQYALISQWSIVSNIGSENLELCRKEEHRCLKMPILYVPDVALRLQFADLSFVAESHPELLQELHLAEQRYTTCLHSVEVLTKEVVTLKDNSNVFNNEIDLKAALNPANVNYRLVFMLKQATDTLYEHVDNGELALKNTIRQLGKYIKRLYPNRKELVAMFKNPDETLLP